MRDFKDKGEPSFRKSDAGSGGPQRASPAKNAGNPKQAELRSAKEGSNL